MPATYSQAYLLGIREGRALLKARQTAGDSPAELLELARATHANCVDNLARHFSGDMAEAFRGERDFWANQIARMTEE
ncbi:MAG: hypothetical protein KGO96_12335 [Elusimicrobia bacterium]|nr:hypothetical protein [Elusimicrobiota bacterium]